jgi:hypothetical protein
MYVYVLYINTECLNDINITKQTFTHLSWFNPSWLWNDNVSLILHIQHLLLRWKAPFYVLYRLGICWKRVNLEGQMVNLTALTWFLTFWLRTICEAHCDSRQSIQCIVHATCAVCGQLRVALSSFEIKMWNLKFEHCSNSRWNKHDDSSEKRI